MANIRELRTQFTATAKGLKSTFKDVKNEIRTLAPTTQKTVDEVNRSYQKLTKQTDELKKAIKNTDDPKAFKGLNKAIDETQKELKETGKVSKDSMDELRSAIKGSSGSFNKLSSEGKGAIKDIERSVDGLEGQLRKLGKKSGLDDLNDQVSELDDNLQSVGNDSNVGGLAAVGAALGSMKGGALAATAAIAGVGLGIVGLIKQGEDLKGSLNDLQVQTGATDQEMKSMEDSLINIYANNYGDSFQDIADKMAKVKQMTGLADKELEEMTQTALMISDTFEDMPVEESVRAADTMMKNFGLTSKEAYTLIAQGAQQGANKNGDLLDVINEYTPQFEAVGFDAEYMMDILVQGAKNGVWSMDKLGDAVKEMNIRMKDGNEETGQALTDLGLDADALREKFAKGGEQGRQAFFQVTNALDGVKDPLEKNQMGVAIFGTQFEDLEAKGVEALANLEGHVDKTGDTLSKIDEIKYDTFGEALQGAGRTLNAELIIPIQQKLMPGVNDLANGFREKLPQAIDAFKEKVKPLKDFLSGVFSFFKNDDGKAVSILARMGLTSDEIKRVKTFVDTLQQNLSRMRDVAVAAFQMIGDKAKAAFDFLLPYIRPVLEEVVSFVGGIVQKIVAFWDENGSQILQAAQNVFNGVKAVISFVMPFVLGIIKTIWGNIKGVISGALDFILGLVKTFSSLFTGDFKGMWEGLKQMFSGAVQFLWNFIQLTFFGKILKGAKAFITAFKSGLQSMWQGVVALFKGSITQAWQLIKNGWSIISNATKTVFTNIWNFLKETWATIKNLFTGTMKFLKSSIKTTWDNLWSTTKTIFKKIYDSIKGRFDDIVSRAKELPGKIGDGIGKMASKVKGGVTKVINALASTLGKGVNGVIGGINWVLDKIGVDSRVPKWDVPQYAQGTKGHKGGLAVVGDGKGSNAGSELITTPDGRMSLSPDKDTLVNLPKGSQVLSAKNTRKFLSSIPAYAKGTGVMEKAWNGVKNIASGVKNAAVDVWSLVTDPKKLFNKALEVMGVQAPSMSGFLGDMAGGLYSKVKDALFGFMKGKTEGMGGTGIPGFGPPFVRTSGYGPRSSPGGIGSTYHRGIDFGAPVGTPIPSQSAGVVSYSGFNGVRGNYVIVRSGNMEYVYQHNQRNLVGVGQSVRKGQIVGTVGSTGASTGPHLHYEVRRNGVPFNPMGYEEGGFINREHMAMVGEGGKQEVVIPLEQHRSRALGLWQEAGKRLGISGETMAVLYSTQDGVVNALNRQTGQIVKQLPIMQQMVTGVHKTKDFLNQKVSEARVGLSQGIQQASQQQKVDSSKTNQNINQEANATQNKVKQSESTVTQQVSSKAGEIIGRVSNAVASNVSQAVSTLAGAINAMGQQVSRATSQAVSRVEAKVATVKRAATQRTSSSKKSSSVKKRSAADKYLAAVRADGDWMNDWATHVPKSQRGKLYTMGFDIAKSMGEVGKYGYKHLKRLRGYADGGIVDTAQLAWIAEGGWAESIISHDPSKRTRSEKLWNQTGDRLGFTQENQAIVQLLRDIRDGVISGRELQIIWENREIGRLVEPVVTEYQTRKKKRSNEFR